MGGGPVSDAGDTILDDRSSGDAIEVSRRSPKLDKDPLGGQSTSGERAESFVGLGDGERGTEQGEERATLLFAFLLTTAEGAQLITVNRFSKSKVYLHPSSYLRDNIPGFLSLVQIGLTSHYLLAWIPEASIEGTPDYESYVLVELFAQHENEPTLVTLPPSHSAHAFSIPLRQMYSVVIQPPTLSSWYGSATFSLFGGETLPPLYFHDEESRSTLLDRERRTEALAAMGGVESWSPGSAYGGTSKVPPSWGGEALLNQLRQYSHVVRSQLEPMLFLINPSKADLEVHSTALFEDEVVPAGQMAGLGIKDPATSAPGGRSILHKSLSGGRDDYPDEVGVSGPGMDNFTFNVFNSFSRITRGLVLTAVLAGHHIDVSCVYRARTAAHSVLSHPLAKPILTHIPQPTTNATNAPGELSHIQESAGVGHYDAARVYLAKWARVVAEEGERARRREVIFAGPGGRLEDSEVGAFEVLAATYKITRPKTTRAAATPIVDTEWAAWFDDEGKLMLSHPEARKRIFQRGLADDVRKEVWPFLLGVFPWESNTKERSTIRSAKTEEYDKLRERWFENTETQQTDRYTEEAHRIEIDCRRTDRTHPMFLSAVVDPAEWHDSPHPPSNGHVMKMGDILTTYVFAQPGRDYVQGMSDLLSPIYVVMEGDEVLSYWCFEFLMERMKGNFLRDQSGMKRQLSELQALIALMDPQLHRHLEETGSLNLFFCFRWILCGFKRELTFEATLQLWEVLWTNHLGTHFHLFFALAIIEAHRDIIIRYLREFDEVLKYFIELSQTLDVDALLGDAEVLYLTFRKVLEASDNHKNEAAAAHPSASGLRRRANGSTSESSPPSTAPVAAVVVDDGAPPDVDETLRALLE